MCDSPGDSISAMGPVIPTRPQFTQLLYLLAQKRQNNEIGSHEVEIHIDGPYGKPFVYDGYERIILVAGGIGVTPCHSIFSTMLSRSIRQYDEAEKDATPLPAVDLIWVAKSKEMFSMYTQTLRSYERHNQAANNSFSVRLFVTRPNGNGMMAHDPQANEFDHMVPGTDTMYGIKKSPSFQIEALDNRFRISSGVPKHHGADLEVRGLVNLLSQVHPWKTGFFHDAGNN